MPFRLPQKQYAELCVPPYVLSSTTEQYAELCVPPCMPFRLPQSNMLNGVHLHIHMPFCVPQIFMWIFSYNILFRVPPNTFSSTTKLIHVENYLTNHTVSFRPPLVPKYILWNFCGIWSLVYNIEIWSDELSFSHFACFATLTFSQVLYWIKLPTFLIGFCLWPLGSLFSCLYFRGIMLLWY